MASKERNRKELFPPVHFWHSEDFILTLMV
jgi:hypothetical protein